MRKIRHMTFTVFSESDQKALTIRLPTIIFYLIIGLLIASLLGLVISVLYSSRLAAKTSLLESVQIENEKLRSYTSKITLLEKELFENRILTVKLAKMAGIELPMLEDTATSVVETNTPTKPVSVPIETLPTAPPAEPPPPTALLPSGLPARGTRIPRSLLIGPDVQLPGTFLAITARISIRATAQGVVEFSGKDSSLGNLVVVTHTQGFKTRYGRLGELKVSRGQKVNKGQTVGYTALPDTTGKSLFYYEVQKPPALPQRSDLTVSSDS